MIYGILENSINSALELDENFDENGNINWDYMHMMHIDVRSFSKTMKRSMNSSMISLTHYH